MQINRTRAKDFNCPCDSQFGRILISTYSVAIWIGSAVASTFEDLSQAQRITEACVIAPRGRISEFRSGRQLQLFINQYMCACIFLVISYPLYISLLPLKPATFHLQPTVCLKCSLHDGTCTVINFILIRSSAVFTERRNV